MNSDEVWPPPPERSIGHRIPEPEIGPKASTIFGIVATGCLLSMILGALTNAINALVSPDYFYIFFGQSVGFNQIWKFSVVEGMQEAGVEGLFVSLIFVIGARFIDRSQLTYKTATRWLVSILAGTLLAWFLGGAIAICAAIFIPDLFAVFDGASATSPSRLSFAWVGGSITGAQIGSLLSLVVVLVRMHKRRRLALPNTAVR